MQALRKFLRKFKLPGESQMIDRILEAFAQAFHKANPAEFLHHSVVHGLAFAVIILNTDAHWQGKNKVKHQRMTRDEFCENTRSMEACESLDQELLEAVYDDITANEIVHQHSKHDEGNLFQDSLKEGWMKKKAAGVAAITWRRRYFILTKNPPQLFYFENEKVSNPKGYIPLEGGLSLRRSSKHKKGLELVPSGGGLVKSAKYLRGKLELGEHQLVELKAESIEESWAWYESINKVLRAVAKVES